MCGRFTLRVTPKSLGDLFDVPELPPFEPRFNIAPTQPLVAVRTRAESTQREAVLLRWGLIPSWAKDPAIGNRLINARADTVAEKPSFRSAFKRRRCLVAADGYYEWQKAGAKKQPYYFRMRDGKPFAFAGLWEAWKPPEGDPIESCTLITTDPNEVAKTVHDRMPVIIAPTDFDVWLDTAADSHRLLTLLRPFPTGQMETYPVSTLVNNPRNENPNCIEPLPAG